MEIQVLIVDPEYWVRDSRYKRWTDYVPGAVPEGLEGTFGGHAQKGAGMEYRKPTGWYQLEHANLHNLKNVNVKLPLAL